MLYIWALIQYDWCSYTRGNWTHELTQNQWRWRQGWGQCFCKLRKAKDGPQTTTGWRRSHIRFFLGASTKNQPCPHFALGLPASRTVKTFLSFKHLWYFIPTALVNEYTCQGDVKLGVRWTDSWGQNAKGKTRAHHPLLLALVRALKASQWKLDTVRLYYGSWQKVTAAWESQ